MVDKNQSTHPEEWSEDVLHEILAEIAFAGHEHRERGGTNTDAIGTALARADAFIGHEITRRIILGYIESVKAGEMNPEDFAEVLRTVRDTGRAF